jgi:hypothetical protein
MQVLELIPEANDGWMIDVIAVVWFGGFKFQVPVSLVSEKVGGEKVAQSSYCAKKAKWAR